MSKQPIYKVIFHNQGNVYELYAKNIHSDTMFGFVAVETLFFDDKSSVVVDPTEERLKNEFEGVEQSYIPIHSIIRIDAVTKKGVAKISDNPVKEGNVMPYPVYTKNDSDSK